MPDIIRLAKPWLPRLAVGGLIAYLAVLATGRPVWLSAFLHDALGPPDALDIGIVFGVVCAYLLNWADRLHIEHKRRNARRFDDACPPDRWDHGF